MRLHRVRSGVSSGGVRIELVAARRRDRPHGPVAERLWHFIEEQAQALKATVVGRPRISGKRRRSSRRGRR